MTKFRVDFLEWYLTPSLRVGKSLRFDFLFLGVEYTAKEKVYTDYKGGGTRVRETDHRPEEVHEL